LNILKIHNAVFPKPINKGKKIQPTTKGPFRKQAIMPMSTKLTEVIMGEANSHIFQINALLKNIKSNLQAEFIYLFPGSLSINTNNVSNPSDLSTMKKYLKSIASANNKKILAPRLPQSKSYLKITNILFIQPNGNKLNSEDINDFMSHTKIFENIFLAAKPKIIKASPKSNMAIIWFDIWDSQSGSSTKLLINHFFNFGRYIATIKATNVNPDVPQYHNY